MYDEVKEALFSPKSIADFEKSPECTVYIYMKPHDTLYHKRITIYGTTDIPFTIFQYEWYKWKIPQYHIFLYCINHYFPTMMVSMIKGRMVSS